MTPDQPLFVAGIAVVALLYAAVGHGGASGYLALLAFTTMPHKESATLALCMNLVVAATSFIAFRRARHFDWAITWPFLAGSVPFAFLGGSLKVDGSIHKWILAGTLLIVAVILMIRMPAEREPQVPHRGAMVGIGAGIGLLSGVVGVGGGIFLSPVLILAGWADAKRTAATSALFIFANSLAGLAARPGSVPEIVQANVPLLVAGLVGALGGAWLGSKLIPNPALRRLLGFVLLFAVFKLIAR